MKNILYICPTFEIAKSMEHRLPKLDNVRFIQPGASICGEGYDLVILFEWMPLRSQDRQWFDEVVATRFMSNTQIIYASDVRS